MSRTGFNYTRLGIRIPTVVISPWIEKNTLVSEPPSHIKPFDSSAWDLTSILATTKKIFDLKGDLTNRTIWAPSFDYLINRSTPRTDCPEKLPDLPPPKVTEMER